MINVSYIKQSPTADEVMETDRERVETMQEESDDEIKTDTTYSLDVVSVTQLTIISDDQENDKKGIYIMSAALVAALDRVKMNERNETYLLTAVINALELDPNNFNISRSPIRRVRISARSKLTSQIQEALQAAPFVHGEKNTVTISRHIGIVIVEQVRILVFLFRYSQTICRRLGDAISKKNDIFRTCPIITICVWRTLLYFLFV